MARNYTFPGNVDEYWAMVSENRFGNALWDYSIAHTEDSWIDLRIFGAMARYNLKYIDLFNRECEVAVQNLYEFEHVVFSRCRDPHFSFIEDTRFPENPFVRIDKPTLKAMEIFIWSKHRAVLEPLWAEYQELSNERRKHIEAHREECRLDLLADGHTEAEWEERGGF